MLARLHHGALLIPPLPPADTAEGLSIETEAVDVLGREIFPVFNCAHTVA